jgi:hypothetical protein
MHDLTAPGSAGDGLPPDQSLAVQAHALHVLAGLIENVGIPGLSLAIDDPDFSADEITIQVPRYLGSPAERTAMVGRLAAAIGATVTRDERPITHGWVSANGKAGGHRVRIFTAIAENQP